MTDVKTLRAGALSSDALLIKKGGRPSIADRLRAGLSRDATTGCLLWTGGKKTTGHGQISVATSTPVSTHRIAWVLERGEIPRGLSVFHRCDAPACCNTDISLSAKRPINRRLRIASSDGASLSRILDVGYGLESTNAEGRYGRLRCEGRHRQAHIASWEARNARGVPSGLLVRHKCDVSLCVNPDHLQLGTHADNMNDRNARGRQARGARHGKAKASSLGRAS